ncbi:MAG: M24 family metallopeptidase, partial [Candidatus Falkowbacteria bacterium]|nr:M24 family metallopeptidase [Candidatus Falkowbacteria bacterium]
MIRLKTDKEIAIIKKGGAILESILDEVISLVKPGVTTAELETLACELMRQVGGKPSFKDYQSSPKDKPFPTALCTSINFEVVHVPAIPGRVLNPGDIIGIDIGMIYEGLFTDMAKTVAVGPISNLAKRLLKVTEAALYKGIDQVKPGNSVWDIGKAIEDYVLANGFSVVKDLAGHG